MLRLRGKKFTSIFVKFATSFILVGLIPLFALSLFSMNAFTGYVERYTTANLQQMVLYMSYNLNSAFDQYNEMSKIMYTGRYEGFVESASLNQTYNVNELEQINNIPIDSFLKTVLYSDPYISSVFFVRESDEKIYFQDKGNRGLDSSLLPYRDWRRQMNGNPSKVAIFPTHSTDYYWDSKGNAFTVGRNLIDISGKVTANPKVVGTLFIDVDVSLFDKFFKELNLGEKDELYLLDGEGQFYFSSRELSDQDKAKIAGQSEKGMMMISEPIPFLNGMLTARIHRASLFQQLLSFRITIFIAIGLCSIALIVMGTWFSRRLSAPILKLMKQMAKVESGNLDTQVEVRSNDELGRLSHSFNRMIDRLKEYIDEAYVAQIKQKQTELNALKSQIRPHFLYNTLEVIRMSAVDKDDHEVADMILSLSNQLKYVIDYGEEKVGIGRELDNVKDYFYIISVRYDQRFEFSYDIASGVDLNWQILKLSLQPIVENAIQHGLKQKGRGTVGLTIEKRGMDLVITVYDDGVGMSVDTLTRLNLVLNDAEAPGKNVGLKNVHERIRSVFGEPYGIVINSREHIGTSIVLTFPIVEEYVSERTEI
ncbi:two-component system, sensor histidine kinase YesM [Fontibacillus panacisegetis]|uniref:histidine kinase n=1 Tax=Fontibacillus panacisegetis TaxID=670482 RepID=A0A1G7RHI9_9BACL|nr:sensor histidine kinase [Fontibacillus panacisegetis]SDG10223.1 two-component system, sensor histidine kinase YesM [Fontibacillus panacisegetis]